MPGAARRPLAGQSEEETDGGAVREEEPADPALVAAEQDQHPDGDRYGGADEGEQAVHLASVEPRRPHVCPPGNCSRIARDCWLVRPGHRAGRRFVDRGAAGRHHREESVMPLSPFERFLPWTGVIAGVAWIAQDFLFHVSTRPTCRVVVRSRSSPPTSG